MLNSPGVEDDGNMTSFVDNSWPEHKSQPGLQLKTMAHDRVSNRHCDFLASVNGLENLYFVNPAPASGETINTPRLASPESSSCTSPSADGNNAGNSHSLLTPKTNSANGAGTSSYPSSPKSPVNSASLLPETYLTAITTCHGETLRNLILPSRWKLSASMIARLVRGCPNIEQLALATEVASLDTLGLLLPFLRNLTAIRLLIPTTAGSSPAIPDKSSQKIHKITDPATLSAISNCSPSLANISSFAEIVDLDDSIHNEIMSIKLADRDICSKLKVIGLGWKVWELGPFYSVPAEEAKSLIPDAKPFTWPEEPLAGGESDCQQIANNMAQTASTSAPQQSINVPPPPPPPPQSSLGKRSRDPNVQSQKPLKNKRPLVIDPFPSTQPNGNANTNGEKEKVLWRRHIRRVGWDVLKHWEIWAMDVQDI